MNIYCFIIVCVGYGMDNKCERQAVFLLKLLVGCYAVLAYAKNNSALLPELRIQISKRTGLLSAAGCHVLRIEIQDYLLSLIICEASHISILIRQGKGRGFGSNFKHIFASSHTILHFVNKNTIFICLFHQYRPELFLIKKAFRV